MSTPYYRTKEYQSRKARDRWGRYKKRYNNDPIYRLKRNLQQVKQRNKHLPFDITIEDLLPIPETCPVLDIPLFFSDKVTDNTPTIDKVIPEQGYVAGNVNIISHKANRLKSDGNLEDFIEIVMYLVTR